MRKPRRTRESLRRAARGRAPRAPEPPMPSLTGGQTDELNRLARERCPVCGGPLDFRASSPVMYGVGQGPLVQLPGSWQVEAWCAVHGLVRSGELTASEELP